MIKLGVTVGLMTNEKFKEWLMIRKSVILGLVIVVMIVLVPAVPVQAVQEMTPERASYIYNVCTGRILVADMSVSGYCTGLHLCLMYKTNAECYTDLKNGEIENFSIFN
jgi:hypothetical protein